MGISLDLNTCRIVSNDIAWTDLRARGYDAYAKYAITNTSAARGNTDPVVFNLVAAGTTVAEIINQQATRAVVANYILCHKVIHNAIVQ